MVTTAGEQGNSKGSLSGFPNLSRAGKINSCTLRSAVPSVCEQDNRPAQKPSVNGREGSDVIYQIPSRSSCAVCFSLSPFTQHGCTGTVHFRLLGKVSQCKPHLQLPSKRVARGSSPYPWQSTLRISGSKASFGGLQLVLAAVQCLLKAPWLLLHLACPHLVLAWLCSPTLL